MLGIKQDFLASLLGDDWTQLKISRLEAKEEIEDGIHDDVARALKIPAEAIKNFDEESALSIVTNTFTSQDTSTLNANPYSYCTFNPLDKMVELFERLLVSEREKVDLMKEMLEKINKS